MQNIKITLPDGNIREYPSGTTGLDVARSISEGLARNVLSADVEGQTLDATLPLTADKFIALFSMTAFI